MMSVKETGEQRRSVMEMTMSRRKLIASLGAAGAVMIGGGMALDDVQAGGHGHDDVWVIGSVADISALSTISMASGQLVYMAGWHSVTAAASLAETIGGGMLLYDPNRSKADHNGGTVFSLTVPYQGSVTDYLAGIGETDSSGSGCLIRVDTGNVGIREFGAVGGDMSCDTPAIDAAFAELREVWIPAADQPYRYDGILNLIKSVRGTSDRPTIRCDGVLVENTRNRLIIENLIFNGAKDYSSASASDDGSVGLDIRAQHCKVDNVIVERYYRGVYVDGWSNTFHSLMVRYCHVSLTGRTNMQNCHFDLFKSINCHALPDLRNSHGILFSIPQFQNYGVNMYIYQSDVVLNAPYFETHAQKPSNGMLLIGSAFETSPSSVAVISPIVNTQEPYIFLNSPTRPTLALLGRRAEKIQIVPVNPGSRRALDMKSVLSDAQHPTVPLLAFGGGLGWGSGIELTSLTSVELGRQALKLTFDGPDKGFRFSGLTINRRYYILFDWELSDGAAIRYDGGPVEQLIGVHKTDGSRVKGVVELYAAGTEGSITFAQPEMTIYRFCLCESVQPLNTGAFKAYDLSHASGSGWQPGDLLVTALSHSGSHQHMWDGTQFIQV